MQGDSRAWWDPGHVMSRLIDASPAGSHMLASRAQILRNFPSDMALSTSLDVGGQQGDCLSQEWKPRMRVGFLKAQELHSSGEGTGLLESVCGPLPSW